MYLAGTSRLFQDSGDADGLRRHSPRSDSGENLQGRSKREEINLRVLKSAAQRGYLSPGATGLSQDGKTKFPSARQPTRAPSGSL